MITTLVWLLYNLKILEHYFCYVKSISLNIQTIEMARKFLFGAADSEAFR
jgi:hypothetical protein